MIIKKQTLIRIGYIFFLILLSTVARGQSHLFTLDMGENAYKQYSSSEIKILFGGSSMIITQDNKTDVVLMKDIKKMFFTDDVLAIKKIPVKNKIVFNPATDQLSVGVQETVAFKIINMMGLILFNTKLQPGNPTIDISSIRSGIYIIQVNDECIKFIKP